MSDQNPGQKGPLPFGNIANSTPFPEVADTVQQRLSELLQMVADGRASDVAAQVDVARGNVISAISKVIQANSVLSKAGSDRIAALVSAELERSWILIEMPQPQGKSETQD